MIYTLLFGVIVIINEPDRKPEPQATVPAKTWNDKREKYAYAHLKSQGEPERVYYTWNDVRYRGWRVGNRTYTAYGKPIRLKPTVKQSVTVQCEGST